MIGGCQDRPRGEVIATSYLLLRTHVLVVEPSLANLDRRRWPRYRLRLRARERNVGDRAVTHRHDP